MTLSVFGEVEGVKHVTIAIPIGKYKRLQEVTKLCGLSVSKLVKEGVDLVLKEYEKKIKDAAKECEKSKIGRT